MQLSFIQAEGDQEQGAKEDVWVYEERSSRRLKRTA
jgi:hypothetical protein